MILAILVALADKNTDITNEHLDELAFLAETAGIKEGDIVMAINTDFSQSLASYKTALQATKERVKVIIKRNNELFSFEFKVKSIL